MNDDVERALVRLRVSGSIIAPLQTGKGFGVFAKGDRRRRPTARLAPEQVRALEASGALSRSGQAHCFVLSSAGAARVARMTAAADEAYAAQHRRVIGRTVMERDGEVRDVRGHDADALRKLAAIKDASGQPWFSSQELAAAQKLRSDWELGQIGLVKGSDLAAPPRGATARGAGNAAEMLAGARCDARRRVAEALSSLAPALRRIVEAVCLADEGLAAVERLEAWPPRSGKLALKLALAQLAARAAC